MNFDIGIIMILMIISMFLFETCSEQEYEIDIVNRFRNERKVRVYCRGYERQPESEGGGMSEWVLIKAMNLDYDSKMSITINMDTIWPRIIICCRVENRFPRGKIGYFIAFNSDKDKQPHGYPSKLIQRHADISLKEDGVWPSRDGTGPYGRRQKWSQHPLVRQPKPRPSPGE